MVKLKVLSNYASQRVAYTKGATVEVDDDLAKFLMADSPGSFEVVPARKPGATKGASNAKA